jgi:glycerate-2-kinase
MTLKDIAERIWRAGLDAAAPRRLISDSVGIRENSIEIAGLSGPSKIFDLSAYENIYLSAFGKAAPGMAAAFMEILGRRVLSGVVVALPGEGPPAVDVPGIRLIEAPHPLPDMRSFEAAREILTLAYAASERDLVFILLSGGGSAQVALPLPGISLEDKLRIARELMLRGADITELNIVRKHLSAIKGGRLAEAAFPAEVVNIVISDVIGDDLGTIASGASYWDSSTYEDARRVLEKFGLWEDGPAPVPATARQIIEDGLAGRIPETPKKDHPAFERVSSFIIGDNALVLEAARREAEKLGFETQVAAAPDQGEARLAAKAYARRLLDLAAARKRQSGSRPICILSGGELTVQVKGSGRGGRNQEFALGVLSELARSERTPASILEDLDWFVASLGTDGIDGNTEAAGAWISPLNFTRARELGLDVQALLDDNDSYGFFSRAGGLIVPGPTGTNVMDLRLMCLR